MKPPRPEIFLIGDVHGQIDRYLSLLATLPPGARSIALGDLYIGRPGVTLPPMDLWHTFIQGNHDDPTLCAIHPNFLGRFGYLEKHDLFFVSGAQTASWRVLQSSKYWYSDEELSPAEFDDAIKLYEKVRPHVVIAHEFPQEAVPVLLQGLAGNYYSAKADCATSRTCVGLQRMLEIHRPEMFFGGHYHVSKEFTLNRTVFRGLGELELCQTGSDLR